MSLRENEVVTVIEKNNTGSQHICLLSVDQLDFVEINGEEWVVISLYQRFHALISGWWLVANSRGEHGFAPATFLEPVDLGQRSEEEEWREVEDDDRKSLI